MKGRKKSVFAALCFAMALITLMSLAACSDKNAGETGNAVAVAGEREITRDEIDDLCAFMAMSYGMSLDDMSESDRATLFNQMLIYMADSAIVKNYIDESDGNAATEAASAVENQLETYKTQIADLEQQISAAGVTDETVKTYIESQYYQELLSEKVQTDGSVTDEEARAYYDAHKDEFVVTPESIALSHILISDEEHKDENRTSIEAIRQRAVDGEDFAELAKQYSADGSAADGGDLGVVTKGKMVAPFEEAGFRLKKDEISDVVESQFGFHVIKANSDLLPAEAAAFEDVKRQIDLTLMIEKLKKEHPVKYNVEVDPETGEPPASVQETTGSGADAG
jgi:foldase protein PrsA